VNVGGRDELKKRRRCKVAMKKKKTVKGEQVSSRGYIMKYANKRKQNTSVKICIQKNKKPFNKLK
jgi:hypothetical protein